MHVTQAEFAKLGSKNTLKVEMLSGGKPWVASSALSSLQTEKHVAELTLLSTRSRPLELPRGQGCH